MVFLVFEIIIQAVLMEENLFSFNWNMAFLLSLHRSILDGVLIRQTCLFTNNKRLISLSLSDALIVHLTQSSLGRLLWRCSLLQNTDYLLSTGSFQLHLMPTSLHILDLLSINCIMNRHWQNNRLYWCILVNKSSVFTVLQS